MNRCPCGSQTNYLSCCGLYINNQEAAKTPEALMRSRYTAYTQANMDYIKKTMLGKPLQEFNELEAEKWSKRVNWIGLQVIKSYMGEADNNTGYVEFIATYMEQNTVKAIHELSQFQRHDGSWFYTEGQHSATDKLSQKHKISRNAPCPCGSQKKFKNCHALPTK